MKHHRQTPPPSPSVSKFNLTQSPLVVIFLTIFLYLVGFGLIIPILPLLAKDFGASPTQIGFLMSAYSIMQFIFAPFWGRISDRVGRRPILLFCLLGESFSYLLFAAARSLPILFLARILAGFFGASLSTAIAYISDVTPPKERSKGMALVGTAFGLGFIIGPALGGFLAYWGELISMAPHFGTSFAILGVSILCFSTFAFAVKYLKESLNKTSIHNFNRIQLINFNRIQLILNHIKKPTLNSLIILQLIVASAMSMMEATLILFLGLKYGWGVKEVSIGFTYIGIMGIINQGFVVRKLLPIFGERIILVTGLIFMGMGLWGISFGTQIPILMLTMTLFSVGSAFTNPSILGSISLLAAETEQGVTLGVAQSMSSLGRIVGPSLGGWLFGSWSPEAPFWNAGYLTFLGLILVMLQYRRLPDSVTKRSSK